LSREAGAMEISVKISYRNDRLQTLRQAAGMSQSQLADTAGISVRILQQYESGERNLNGAKLQTLLKICNALKCRLSEIITDVETGRLLEVYDKQ
jgi:transcriptional regulator with XRE-family HTH domain